MHCCAKIINVSILLFFFLIFPIENIIVWINSEDKKHSRKNLHNINLFKPVLSQF